MPVFFVHDPAQGIITPLDRKFTLREISEPDQAAQIGRIHRTTGDETTPRIPPGTQREPDAQPETPEQAESATLTVKDIMTEPALCGRDTHSLRHAWNTMLKYEIHHLAIIDDQMRLKGMLSTSRILHFLLEHEQQGQLPSLDTVTLDDFCQQQVLSTHPNVSVPALAEALLELGLDGVPVCQNGALIGMVTYSNLVKTLLKHTVVNVEA